MVDQKKRSDPSGLTFVYNRQCSYNGEDTRRIVNSTEIRAILKHENHFNILEDTSSFMDDREAKLERVCVIFS